MKSSLRALLNGVFDYAGMFPPARLPLAEAVRNYVKYMQSPQRWLLGRFVCPIANLEELFRLPEFAAAKEFRIAATGRVDGTQELQQALQQCDAAMEPLLLCDPNANLKVQLSLELALSAELVDRLTPKSRLEGWLSGPLLAPLSALAWIENAFVELPWDCITGEKSVLGRWASAVSDHNFASENSGVGRRVQVGLKFRAGGLTASEFPTVQQLANVISTCRISDVPWKATAGLHQPLRHWDTQIGVHVHGFINLLAAAVLGRGGCLLESHLRRVLEEETPKPFVWTDTGMQFEHWRVTCKQIENERRTFFTSIGTCSIDEPLADLRELGWLDEQVG